jgi:DNA replication protein DnaC
VEEWDKQAQAEAEAQQERLGTYAKAFPTAEMGPRLIRARFGTFERRPGTETALQAALRFAVTLPNPDPPGLLLCGPAGNGKSHLGAAITQEAMAKGLTVAWVHAPSWLEYLGSLNDRPDERQRLLRLATEADLLVLDEFGGGKLTPSRIGWMLSLVDSRYRKMAPLVVTQNPGPEELVAVMRRAIEKAGGDDEGDLSVSDAERIMDRLLEHCDLVGVRATSYRLKMAEERLRGG